jgi:hypothetical protein
LLESLLRVGKKYNLFTFGSLSIAGKHVSFCHKF